MSTSSIPPTSISPQSSINPFGTLSRQPTISSIEDEHAIHGYPRLARFMGRFPGYAIFRRFASLNARLLLYFQAEIVELEHDLDRLEKMNKADLKLHQVVRELRTVPEGSNGKKQWDKAVELRDKLNQYNKMILEHNKLYELPTPSDNDVDDLFNYLHSDDTGGRWLEAPENTPWEVDESRKRKNQDLISLNVRRTSDDIVTKWMNDSLAYYIHKFFGKRKKSDEEFGLVFYDEAASDRFTSNLTIILSSLLPTASIFALYFITSPLMRLIFIVLWSGVFSACLALFTTATRIQIFTASVAMASVQVVFMGTNGVPVP